MAIINPEEKITDYASPQELFDELATKLSTDLAEVFPDLRGNELVNAARASALGQIIAASFDEERRMIFLWANTLRQRAEQVGAGAQFAQIAREAGLTGLAFHVISDEDPIVLLAIETTLSLPQVCEPLHAILQAHSWTLDAFTECLPEDLTHAPD